MIYYKHDAPSGAGTGIGLRVESQILLVRFDEAGRLFAPNGFFSLLHIKISSPLRTKSTSSPGEILSCSRTCLGIVMRPRVDALMITV